MKRWIWLVFLLNLHLARAHGDFHFQMERLSEMIIEHPDSAYLHFKKGKLFFHHEDYKACLKSLKKSQQKGYHDALQTLFLSKAYFELGQLKKAGKYAQSVIEQTPEHVTAHRILGRIRYAQKRYAEAGDAFEIANQHAIRPIPENYLETAKAWEALQTPEGIQRAILMVEKGINELGKIISLQNFLKTLLIKKGESDQAISLQKRIIDRSTRKEKPWYELSKMYLQIGDIDKSEYALNHAKNAFDMLPQRIQHTPAMIDLNQLIINDLKNIKQLPE
jgi:tetratricopeptide (TPR) repeat protein